VARRTLTGFYLTIDCPSAGCHGERQFAIAELAAFYRGRTVRQELRAIRCKNGRGDSVLAAWLERGRYTRVWPRRVPFLGPEARE
jgi:hypothetical protein